MPQAGKRLRWRGRHRSEVCCTLSIIPIKDNRDIISNDASTLAPETTLQLMVELVVEPGGAKRKTYEVPKTSQVERPARFPIPNSDRRQIEACLKPASSANPNLVGLTNGKPTLLQNPPRLPPKTYEVLKTSQVNNLQGFHRQTLTNGKHRMYHNHLTSQPQTL